MRIARRFAILSVWLLLFVISDLRSQRPKATERSAAASVAAASSATAQAETALHVSPAQLRDALEKLSEFGRPDGGTFDDGVTRLGFSEADLAAREYVMGRMRSAGLEVRVDPAGNIVGRRASSEDLPVILFGSHIDSVPNGGNFDGDVGSMGAIEVIRAMNEHGVRTRHPLEVVIWTNEEGHHFGKGLFGSSAAAGLLPKGVLDRRDEQGLSIADWLRRYGQDPAKFSEAKLADSYLAAYLELHIEQGGILDREKIPIGVVEGIVGINWYTCHARGFANHAGTTPMDQRRDALAAAAKAVLAVREEVRREPGRQVGTVGYMKVEPGARNIIPARVEFPVELRDLDAEKIERIWGHILRRFAQIEREENVSIHCDALSSDKPALTDPAIRQAIRQATDSAGFKFLEMPSGAGHDAQQMARLAPIGMIFIPSRGGISHSPREFSDWDDIARGAEVLYRTILLLDGTLHPR